MPAFESAPAEPVLLRRDGAVAILQLNRPAAFNALDVPTAQAFLAACQRLAEADDIRAVVLSGAGRSFGVGGDLAAMRDDGAGVAAQLIDSLHPAVRILEALDAPVIASLQGAVAGGSMSLALSADLAIAAEDATFSHAEQRLGLAGNTWHLNSQILMYGAKKARELLLLGDNFDGRDAERMGLVNRAVPLAELESTVEDWARRIARHARDALVTGKAMHQMALDSLGGSQQFWRGYVGHTLGTNLRFEEDEFNFLRERARGGTTKTFKRRDDSFE